MKFAFGKENHCVRSFPGRRPLVLLIE